MMTPGLVRDRVKVEISLFRRMPWCAAPGYGETGRDFDVRAWFEDVKFLLMINDVVYDNECAMRVRSCAMARPCIGVYVRTVRCRKSRMVGRKERGESGTAEKTEDGEAVVELERTRNVTKCGREGRQGRGKMGRREEERRKQEKAAEGGEGGVYCTVFVPLGMSPCQRVDLRI